MAKKQHDCIKMVRDNLMERDPSIKYIIFKISDIVNINDRDAGTKTGQAIEIGYKHKNKSEKSFVVHNFCPFCGKAYK